MNLNRQIFFTFILLLGSVYYFGVSDIDIKVQDYFFNFDTHKWILPWSLQPYKFIFYDGIKKLLILFAVSLLIVLVVLRKKPFLKKYKKGLLVVILSALFVPAIASGMKSYTNMPCPKDEIHYGGLYPRTAVWQQYPQEFTLHHKKTKCWPAGHASGGFALMSLFFLFQKRRNKFLALGAGFVIGWSMGGYKMIIGDHFLSHTVITMILAWLIILIIARFVFGERIVLTK